MSLDLARLRADTPGCELVAHLNNAGAALSPDPVVEAVVDHLRLEARVGGYEAAALADGALEATGASVARLLGVDPLDVALLVGRAKLDEAVSVEAAWDCLTRAERTAVLSDEAALARLADLRSAYPGARSAAA